MLQRILTVSAFALLVAALSASAQGGFSSLEERMSGKEFREAGLEKLSPEELAELNTWIRENVAHEAVPERAPPGPADAGRDDSGDRQEIVTTIPGRFTGWGNNSVFELENGQIWRQISGSSHRVNMEDPTVIIYPVSFGGWRMRLEAGGPSIGVKRVR